MTMETILRTPSGVSVVLPNWGFPPSFAPPWSLDNLESQHAGGVLGI